MGRKIPAKKHRGVKDPLVQQARRLQSVKDKINAPPRDPDEQPVPRSLTRLFQLAERPARPKRPKRPPRTAKGAGDDGGVGDKGAVSRLRRLPGEAPRAFGRRIAGAVRALHQHQPQGYPEYGSDAEGSDEEDVRGARMAWQRERRARRTARRAREGAAGAAGAAGRGEGDAGGGLTRKQRRRLRVKEKKADKESAGRSALATEPQYERVPFGAVASAPPALRPPRRAPPSRKAGARGLALCATLSAGGGVSEGSAVRGVSGVSGASDAIEAERRERARQQAVAAYRALKRQARPPLAPRPP